MSLIRVLTPAPFLTLAAMPLSAVASWLSDEMPPDNAKPLSEIIKGLEAQGYSRITEVDFDDGRWRIEAHPSSGKELHLEVDPVTGRITNPTP